MKKLVSLCLLLVLATGAFADKKKDGCSSKTTPTGDVTFYGVDYSFVRFFDLKEAPAYAQRILPEINRLFTSEAKKFDVQKYMQRTVVKMDFDYVNSVTKSLVSDSLVTKNEGYQLSEDDVKTAILKYPAATEDGIGLVFIAELMNKKADSGSYYVTFFDLKTKAVLSTCRVSGKAGGFGLRNYWAGSVYNLMKSWK